MAKETRDRPYTIISDSTAAISRAATDGQRTGQALAAAIIEAGDNLRHRGNTVTIRWTLAHKGVEGNEVAGD